MPDPITSRPAFDAAIRHDARSSGELTSAEATAVVSRALEGHAFDAGREHSEIVDRMVGLGVPRDFAERTVNEAINRRMAAAASGGGREPSALPPPIRD